MPSDLAVYFTSRLIPGADTLSSLAAPPMVPVTMTARITSTWRSVIICPIPQTSCSVRHQRWPAGICALPLTKEAKPQSTHLLQKLPVFEIGHKPLSANDARHGQPSSHPGIEAHSHRSGEAVRSGLNSWFRLCTDNSQDCLEKAL